MTHRILIRDLGANQFLEGVYAIQNCQLGMTRGGKPFLKCLLADRTGRTPGRMWNTTEQLYQSLPTDGFVFIEGQTQPYQGELQIIIQTIAAVDPSEQDLLDLLPSTKHDIDEMLEEVKSILRTIEHPALGALTGQYLNDPTFVEKFARAPAATTLHHAYLGGLLEHTLSLLRLADRIHPEYPQLNRDIVLVGLFLHDLGKCVELNWERGFSYSDDGHLVGHIARGVLWLQQKADRCAQEGNVVPEPVLRVLYHIVLSHHGKAEFGALKVPATPEAILISQLDNLDAKLNMAIAATRDDVNSNADLGGNFTERIWVLDTRMYRPDPTKLSAETPNSAAETAYIPK